jgi:hypothetical protein
MGRSILSTAFRYALFGGGIGVLTELLVPTIAPALGLLGLIPVILMYLVSLPLWLMVHNPTTPIWVLPLNLTLWGLVVGAIVGGFRAGKAARGSDAS